MKIISDKSASMESVQLSLVAPPKQIKSQAQQKKRKNKCRNKFKKEVNINDASKRAAELQQGVPCVEMDNSLRSKKSFLKPNNCLLVSAAISDHSLKRSHMKTKVDNPSRDVSGVNKLVMNHRESVADVVINNTQRIAAGTIPDKETTSLNCRADIRATQHKEKRRLFKVDQLRGVIESMDRNGDLQTAKVVPAVVSACAVKTVSNATHPPHTVVSKATSFMRGKKESLRDRMLKQLSASRFRFLNEELYKSSSGHAVDIFKSDPDAFDVYHHGYQSQVSKWPINPVDKMIDFILQW